MTTSWHMFILIVLCGLVTLIIRVVPFLMISRIQLSETVIKWLSFIPITLFTALILDGIIEQQEGVAGYTLNIPFVLVTIPTVLLHFYTKSYDNNISGYCSYSRFTFLLLEKEEPNN